MIENNQNFLLQKILFSKQRKCHKCDLNSEVLLRTCYCYCSINFFRKVLYSFGIFCNNAKFYSFQKCVIFVIRNVILLQASQKPSSSLELSNNDSKPNMRFHLNWLEHLYALLVFLLLGKFPLIYVQVKLFISACKYLNINRYIKKFTITNI